MHHSISITTDYKVNVFKLSKDLWNYSNKKINTFSILQPRDKNNVYLIWISTPFNFFLSDFRTWIESLRVNCIWDGEGFDWIELSSEDEVVFAGVANTYCSVEISEAPLDKLVEMYSMEVSISKQRMLSEDVLRP